jgi:hypothetical protein
MRDPVGRLNLLLVCLVLLAFGCVEGDGDGASGEAGDAGSDTDSDDDSDDAIFGDRFGTITPDEHIPGHVDVKGGCGNAVQSGYYRFDLSEIPEDFTYDDVTITFFVVEPSETYHMLSDLEGLDPFVDPPGDLFDAIIHSMDDPRMISAAIRIDYPGMMTLSTKPLAIWGNNPTLIASRIKSIINEALAMEDPADRWVAFIWGFE